jgi:hypothetical protein
MCSLDRETDIELAMDDFYTVQAWLINDASEGVNMQNIIDEFEDNGFLVDVYGEEGPLNEKEIQMPIYELDSNTVSIQAVHGPSGDVRFQLSLSQPGRQLIVHTIEEGRH